MIIDSDYETLTIKLPDGEIINRNIDEYNLLKYNDYKGERIIKEFEDGTLVQETFNSGIFNIRYNDSQLQVRDKLEIAKRLKYCIENNTTEPIKELLLKNIESELKNDILIRWLTPFGYRLKPSKEEIIIDDIFKVDKNGQAYYYNNKRWNFLCIVASKTGQLNHIVKHDLGELKIDFKTMEIYNKVLFLLFPNINDSVFTNQLPAKLRKQIKENMENLGI